MTKQEILDRIGVIEKAIATQDFTLRLPWEVREEEPEPEEEPGAEDPDNAS